MSKPTKGRIKAEHCPADHPGVSDYTIYTTGDEYTQIWIANTRFDKPEDKANADLIVAAWNACVEINPDNPQAAAEAMPEIFRLICHAQAFIEEEAEMREYSGLEPYIRSARDLADRIEAVIRKATAREEP